MPPTGLPLIKLIVSLDVLLAAMVTLGAVRMYLQLVLDEATSLYPRALLQELLIEQQRGSRRSCLLSFCPIMDEIDITTPDDNEVDEPSSRLEQTLLIVVVVATVLLVIAAVWLM